MKKLIYICLFAGSIVGSGVGSLLDHGNFFGTWSMVLGTVGAIAGVWIGFKLGQ